MFFDIAKHRKSGIISRYAELLTKQSGALIIGGGLSIGMMFASAQHSEVFAGAVYLPQEANYTATHFPYRAPRLGDGSTASGGTPPAFATQPPDIPSNFNVKKWTVKGYFPYSASGGDAKFRTTCNYSHHRADDPIVLPGKPKAAHMHTFLGNTKTDAQSTYKSLRTKGGSTCGGGPINRSAYWYPSVLKDNAIGDGKTMIVKPDFATVYYNVSGAAPETLTHFPRGMSYVFGFNPHDPQNSKVKAEVARANKSGSGKLYASYNIPGNGFVGWKCEISNGAMSSSPIANSPIQPYLRNADGTATLTCPVQEHIAVMISSPQCWDGVNLGSPDGRSHVRYMIYNFVAGMWVCPIGWYRMPTFDMITFFGHKGPDDYKNWYLSSDRMPGHKRFLNGQSFHADWFGAWDYDVMKKWMANCNGLTIEAKRGKPHSCIDTQFGDGTAGLVHGAAPDRSRNPQVDLSSWINKGNRRFDPLPN